ncbi:DUF4258 domain-containing protein [Halomonas campisalis]|uniref:DUF4258 domain-containing protein n=1 Tax=Billgrantia campisalis TaxID=74661 RepID=A0ABS9P5D9_9GAMM|nr:DUF4258 domain-containing protein [Halomonas campisalis]MCG6657001.1 DUF4258 domain-containing protein [Halomonas campisalis]MDR5862187.1 DUF4258 domain-containing protein [Halomonas campisalis]
MHSKRFARDVYITRHARERMTQRAISEAEVVELLETGRAKYKDDSRMWIAKSMPGRDDNLVCAAVVLEDRLIIKTIMHHFVWEA